MNQFNHSEEDAIKKILEETAQQIKPGSVFTANLEKQLKQAHKPKVGFNMLTVKKISSPIGWTFALIALAIAFNWIASQIAPKNAPASNNSSFVCPVTLPNGNVPPGETAQDDNYFGNGELWTALWPNGKIYMTGTDQNENGSFSMKWPWWRGVTGELSIEGQRLDANAEPLRAEIPEGYGDIGFQVSGLIFPTTGCWEVTGHVGDSSLTFISEVVFGEATPQPDPFSGENTPVAENGTPEGRVYQWNGQSVYLNAPFPEAPAAMKIYLAKDELAASVEDVQTLAQKFGMTGEIYQVPGEIAGTTDYLMVDENQQLRIRSDRYFTYYPNYAESINSLDTKENPNANTLIDEFMRTHGFDLNYKIEHSEFYGGYLALPLTFDGFTIHHEHFSTNGYIFEFNENGIVSVRSSLINYQGIVTAQVISAEEAFNKLLNPNNYYGILSGMHSAHSGTSSWRRVHSLDQTFTYYGFLNSTNKSITGAAPLITLDGYRITGTVQNVPENMPNTFIEAVGQFHELNGVKIFELESWKNYDGFEEGYQGTILQEGDQTLLITTEGKKLSLLDIPADLPLPAENIFITGVTRGGEFDWKNIDNRSMTGGGGGGGGSGFYKLNISNTPMPIPTPIPTLQPPILEPHQFEKQRGIIGVAITTQNDGSQRVDYLLATNNPDYPYLFLEGENLQSLQAYHNRPIEIWGAVDRFDKNGNIVVKVDKFEVPFPDLQFKILKGSEKIAEIEGNNTILFTEDNGQSYVELAPNCYDMISPESIGDIDEIGQGILIEALIVPDQTLGGYPTVCIFSRTIAVNPTNGEPVDLEITADQPYITDESIPSGINPPTMNIENVELVYFTPDMRYYPTPDPNAEPPYLQPAWRFSGHYSNGSEFEFIVQALKAEFLSPDIQESHTPG